MTDSTKKTVTRLVIIALALLVIYFLYRRFVHRPSPSLSAVKSSSAMAPVTTFSLGIPIPSVMSMVPSLAMSRLVSDR